jgi:hypothetical protein
MQHRDDLVHARLHPAVLVLLHEVRGDRGGDHAEERDAGDHEDHGDRTAGDRHRVLVAVADAGHGDGRPPERAAVGVDGAALGVRLEGDLQPGRGEHDRDYHGRHVVQALALHDRADVADPGAHKGHQPGRLQQPERAQPAQTPQRAQRPQRPQEREGDDGEIEKVAADERRTVLGERQPHAVVQAEQCPDHAVHHGEGLGHGPAHGVDQRDQQHRDHQERERGHRRLAAPRVAIGGFGAPPPASGHAPKLTPDCRWQTFCSRYTAAAHRVLTFPPRQPAAPGRVSWP